MADLEQPKISGIRLSPLESPPNKEKKKMPTETELPATETPASNEPAMLSPDQAARARQVIAEQGIMGVDGETRKALREYDKATQPSYPAAELIKSLQEKNLNVRSRGSAFAEDFNPGNKPFMTLDDVFDKHLVLDRDTETRLIKQANSEGLNFYDLVANEIEQNLGVKAVRENS